MEHVSPQPAGRHVLADLDGVDAAVLDDTDRLRAALAGALTAAGATVRQVVAEAFEPHGVTVVALLAESHASIHTWPEHGRALVDVFTCGDAADPELAVVLLAETLGAGVRESRTEPRGAARGRVVEPVSPGLTRTWEIGRVHHRETTPFQHLLIADTAHGVTLFCDDERQSAESTQLTYHEALYVPAVLWARRRERVLVVGSSEGVVSELAIACGATLVDHVDVDTAAVRACAAHLPYGYTPDALVAAERGDGPVRVHYADGREWVRGEGPRYDVIVVDLPDERPDDAGNQLNRLYTRDFLADCRDRLTDGGVVVSQAGSAAVWRDATLRAAWDRFHDVFAHVRYVGSDEHEWSFLVGGADPGEPELAALPYRPVTIDAEFLRSRTVAPVGLRRR
ncbi:adenosylmethionine decarboxylase [Pseudonocardia sp. N23]|uniref:adenosylmethionine decarboxylase n=1 Tax=Pseudonocardia sp. N23 TaxID=1987376 RepID=UPI0015587740|nr:adenosylmethionine decarboxylase [Pseudonocardia sp. N23]